MRSRPRAAATAVALGLAATAVTASTSSAAQAAPAPTGAAAAPAVPTVVEVPVACTFSAPDPADNVARFTTRVHVTAPSSVPAGSRFTASFQVEHPIMADALYALAAFGFTNTFAVEGATPAGPLVLEQAPVAVPLHGHVDAEVFSRSFTTGAAGSTARFGFNQVDYTFRFAGDSAVEHRARCLPEAGPTAVASTTVTAAERPQKPVSGVLVALRRWWLALCEHLRSPHTRPPAPTTSAVPT